MDNHLPFETVVADGITLFAGELVVVVSRILEADEEARTAELVALVNGTGFFPLCRRFDNVPLAVVAAGLLLPAVMQAKRRKKNVSE